MYHSLVLCVALCHVSRIPGGILVRVQCHNLSRVPQPSSPFTSARPSSILATVAEGAWHEDLDKVDE